MGWQARATGGGGGPPGRGAHHVAALIIREALLQVKPEGLKQQSNKVMLETKATSIREASGTVTVTPEYSGPPHSSSPSTPRSQGP